MPEEYDCTSLGIDDTMRLLSLKKKAFWKSSEWVRKVGTLELLHRHTGYSVDLERCRSSSEVLDRIVQVQKHGWCTPETLYDLLHALDLICDLQANMCPGGREIMCGRNWARQERDTNN